MTTKKPKRTKVIAHIGAGQEFIQVDRLPPGADGREMRVRLARIRAQLRAAAIYMPAEPPKPKKRRPKK